MPSSRQAGIGRWTESCPKAGSSCFATVDTVDVTGAGEIAGGVVVEPEGGVVDASDEDEEHGVIVGLVVGVVGGIVVVSEGVIVADPGSEVEALNFFTGESTEPIIKSVGSNCSRGT